MDIRPIADALVATLTGAEINARFATAPTGDPDLYVVVELPPGSIPVGTLGLPEGGLDLRVRLRTVARHVNVESAARACLEYAAKAQAALLDRTAPIDGEGWAIEGRSVLADAGLDTIGPIANHMVDLQLHVARANA